jgi:sec-independent protein translocase protein TatA
MFMHDSIFIAFIFGGIGTLELIVIGVVAVLLFGSKLPEVARTLGGSYNEFRRGLNDIQSSIKKELDAEVREVKKLPEYLDNAQEEVYDEPAAPKFQPPAEDEEANV